MIQISSYPFLVLSSSSPKEERTRKTEKTEKSRKKSRNPQRRLFHYSSSISDIHLCQASYFSLFSFVSLFSLCEWMIGWESEYNCKTLKTFVMKNVVIITTCLTLTSVIFISFLICSSSAGILIRVCNTSQYKRVVEDTCSSVYKRGKGSAIIFNSYGTYAHRRYRRKRKFSKLLPLSLRSKTSTWILFLKVLYLTSVLFPGSPNYGFSDLPTHCCAIGCPHSVYADHCNL